MFIQLICVWIQIGILNRPRLSYYYFSYIYSYHILKMKLIQFDAYSLFGHLVHHFNQILIVIVTQLIKCQAFRYEWNYMKLCVQTIASSIHVNIVVTSSRPDLGIVDRSSLVYFSERTVCFEHGVSKQYEVWEVHWPGFWQWGWWL